MKSVINRMIWVGRATMLAVGLAVTLALTIGAATTALAAVPGDPFRLGQVNLINTISVLGGNTNNPMMRIINNSEGTNATALDIQVKPNRPPMKVNSSTEVQGLNVDSLDGRNSSEFLQESSDRDDFLPDDTYIKDGIRTFVNASTKITVSASCDSGDIALTGGYEFESDLAASGRRVVEERTSDGTYQLTFFNDAFDIVTANVTCADFPPLR